MAAKPVKSSNIGHIVSTILLVSLSIVLMVADFRGKVDFVRDAIQNYISLPIKSTSTWPNYLNASIASFFRNHNDLRNENASLKREITWLKANLANQTVLEAEYRRLKRLFESSALRPRPVMIAEVLDSQIDASKHQIEINKGTRAGVFDGQVVIDENGVVGQVTRAMSQASIVSLITDERQLIPVFIERNRLRMIARGTGDLSELEMEFVNKKADVRIGDKIVTSGLGDRYPRGYSIGIITAVTASPTNEFLDIEAKPLAALDKVLEVLLIRTLNPLPPAEDNRAAIAPRDATRDPTKELSQEKSQHDGN